jgi:glycosyltransferase involved in cell wall biosynthesis
MVARMEEPKDHSTLLRALAQLTNYNWELDLIGEGPLERQVRQLVLDLSLTPRVRFLGDAGWCVNRHLAGHQVFVLTTDCEGFPRGVLEAMRAGLPVVATDIGGIREAVIHRDTGLLVPKRNVGVLRDHLRMLVTDPQLRVKMGAAARRRYLSEFTFEKMHQETLALYREVLLSRSEGKSHSALSASA